MEPRGPAHRGPAPAHLRGAARRFSSSSTIMRLFSAGSLAPAAASERRRRRRPSGAAPPGAFSRKWKKSCHSSLEQPHVDALAEIHQHQAVGQLLRAHAPAVQEPEEEEEGEEEEEEGEEGEEEEEEGEEAPGGRGQLPVSQQEVVGLDVGVHHLHGVQLLHHVQDADGEVHDERLRHDLVAHGLVDVHRVLIGREERTDGVRAVPTAYQQGAVVVELAEQHATVLEEVGGAHGAEQAPHVGLQASVQLHVDVELPRVGRLLDLQRTRHRPLRGLGVGGLVHGGEGSFSEDAVDSQRRSPCGGGGVKAVLMPS
ncbi:hypothetical protein EYF80_028170 [Liparis tanakae]|uniref:Uncharacterized protein n=1 Tax=Liparis tanakae TaxID=230148 RepID=A0A4Z2H6L5_9TELE|nr:hypothetical protein EYF80_028170 [Liparis tanakae]